MVFDCSTCHAGPDADAYAYVNGNAPYRVYLCNRFWTAPLSGTDSKSGTLVHEVSHFAIVANTSDYAYTQPNCANLAISNPASAVMNGDSHEYFAENMPLIVMPAEGAGIAMLPAIF